mmetsp:Transcript_9406/g.17044  ORF Transcript_9406/g.17044 Transcript_9406/m.17044 type:complete len:154 (-) Transcript_9406:85-546(-)
MPEEAPNVPDATGRREELELTAAEPIIIEDDLVPEVVKVQFMWAVETFRRTDAEESGRPVYRSRGSLDGHGGLRLRYNSQHSSGCWEIGGSSGPLYRMDTAASSPLSFVGKCQWKRVHGGRPIFITVGVSHTAEADEPSGWIEPALLAQERKW